MEAAAAATSKHAPAPTEIINAHFGCCFFSALGYPSAANQAFASVHQSSNRKEDASGKSFVDLDLTMSLQKPLEGQFVALGHAPECPARLIQYPEHEKLKQPMPNRDLRVGVCCVVEHKNKVLITRRAATLRTFPLKWVFPGGHVNFGERLEDAACREVLEETGLFVTDLKPIACWESCFPTFLESGPPTAHHLVIYYLARLDETKYGNSFEFPGLNEVKLQVEECDAAAWVSPELVRSCLQDGNVQAQFEAILVSEHGSNSIATCHTGQLLGVENRGAKFESLALGTAFVLEKWLDTLKS